MRLFSTLLPLLTLAISVNAHAIFQELYVNGVSAGHMEGIRVPDYNGVRVSYFSIRFLRMLTSRMNKSPQ